MGAPVAHLEITSACVRVFNDGGPVGSPFDFSFSVAGDEGTAIIKGLRTDGLTTAHRVAIARELARYDFHTMTWRRHKGGRVYAIEKPTGLITSSWRPRRSPSSSSPSSSS